jgi:MFS family permease
LLSGSAIGTVIASFILGLSSGYTIPLVLALGCEWHPENTALGTIVPYTALFSANMLFPPLSGLIGDLFGIPLGVAVTAVSAIMVAVFSGLLNRHLKHESV